MSNLGADILQTATDLMNRQRYMAFVVESVGTRVRVRQPGQTPEGPYSAPVGVAGNVKPGDIVYVDWSAGQPIVQMPIERGQRSVPNLLASDPTTAQTTSPTDWVPMLDSGPLEIPDLMPFRIEWHAEIEVVGAEGAAQKQHRLVFNEATVININLGPEPGEIWLPWMVSNFPTGLAFPARTALLLTTSGPAIASIPGTITRIRVEARTQDTAEGNDIVRASTLVVSA
ncbi:MAG: hypothetical protein M0R73_13400 [Dehalococcoidia bacterium]|nr:hypothetical protein [Dehalococcoidia bacterium]